MDTNDGFFPEREVLRARRLRARAEQPVDLSEARDRRAGVWMTLSVAVLLPMFVNAITSGGNGHVTPRSLEVLKYSLWLLLAACGVLVAVGLWTSSMHRLRQKGGLTASG